MAFGFHLALLFLFQSLEVYPLARFNVGSSVWWLLSLVLLKRGFNRQFIVAMDSIELFAHQCFATYLLGWEAGFPMLITPVVPLVFLGGFRNVRWPLVFTFTSLGLYLGAYFLTRGYVPPYQLPQSTLIALFVVATLSFFTFSGLFSYIFSNAARKAENTLLKNNHELATVNEALIASIQYAQRIQRAVLPPPEALEKQFADSMVLFRPRDIVSGDFFWTDNTSNGRTYFAVADCTGHGVPGALMSVMCSKALTEALLDLGDDAQPALILDRTADLIDRQLSQSQSTSIRDGMDIALCCHRPADGVLEYAGAHHSLYHLGGEGLQEVRADRQPIGSYPKRRPFTHHQVAVQPGDCVYLTTDGFIDQFGGPENRKFMKKPFKQMLQELGTVSMAQQKREVERIFESWKGSRPQLDDVCLLGVRF